MIALASLYIIVLGLLFWATRLLQKYFDTYSDLHQRENDNIEKLKKRIKEQEATNQASRIILKEINSVINSRLKQMEEQFPSPETEKETQPQKLDVLTKTLKCILSMYMKLLKVEVRDSKS